MEELLGIHVCGVANVVLMGDDGTPRYVIYDKSLVSFLASSGQQPQTVGTGTSPVNS